MIKQDIIKQLYIGKLTTLGAEGVLSGIHKLPVKQAYLSLEGLKGDNQADKQHHGGIDKALHHYPANHYDYWLKQLAIMPEFYNSSAFGENLSTQSLTEVDMCIGDIWQLDQAIVEVSQPRQPCWKLNLRFQREDMALQVQQSRKTGWYYRVLTPGVLATGYTMTLLERPYPQWTIQRLVEVIYDRVLDKEILSEIAVLKPLSQSWRSLAKQRIKTDQIEDWLKRLVKPAPQQNY